MGLMMPSLPYGEKSVCVCGGGGGKLLDLLFAKASSVDMTMKVFGDGEERKRGCSVLKLLFTKSVSAVNPTALSPCLPSSWTE